MTADRISEVLYRHDPANTGCNVCEGMEDEYDRIAGAIAEIPLAQLTFEAFRAVLVDAFFEDALSDRDLKTSYAEIVGAAA